MDKERQSIRAQLRFFLQQIEEQERKKMQEKEVEEERDERESYGQNQ